MAWCRQAASHYLSHVDPDLPPYGVTRPQWVKASARYVLLVISRVSDHDCMIRLGCFDTWLYEVFAGINIATINCEASLVQVMAGDRVGGKPLSEPSIDALHKCIYMYTPSRLDLLTYRVLLLTVIVEPQRAMISANSTSTTNMTVWPSRLWWNLSLDRKLLLCHFQRTTQAISLKVRDIHCCKRLKYWPFRC